MYFYHLFIESDKLYCMHEHNSGISSKFLFFGLVHYIHF